MTEPKWALMKVRGEGRAPSLEDAARQLNVSVDALDASFGVVLIDPAQHLYTVRIDASQLGPNQTGSDDGPYSDPKIEPLTPH
jgi:hypothetical protein